MAFSNIVNHPKTTIAGIVAGLATILFAFGIDVDEATKDSIVTLGAILVPVLIGAWAHDPKAEE
jgi:hypothetical protein